METLTCLIENIQVVKVLFMSMLAEKKEKNIDVGLLNYKIVGP